MIKTVCSQKYFGAYRLNAWLIDVSCKKILFIYTKCHIRFFDLRNQYSGILGPDHEVFGAIITDIEEYVNESKLLEKPWIGTLNELHDDLKHHKDHYTNIWINNQYFYYITGLYVDSTRICFDSKLTLFCQLNQACFITCKHLFRLVVFSKSVLEKGFAEIVRFFLIVLRSRIYECIKYLSQFYALVLKILEIASTSSDLSR